MNYRCARICTYSGSLKFYFDGSSSDGERAAMILIRVAVITRIKSSAAAAAEMSGWNLFAQQIITSDCQLVNVGRLTCP